MKWRMGFGLETIGLAAQKWPKLFSALLLSLILISAVSIKGLSFDGSVISVLPDQSAAFKDYYKLKRGYRNFSRDVTILVESDRLLTAEGLDDLRDLQLDISLSDGVAKAVTIFSSPSFDPQTGELQDWFPDEFTSDEIMMQRIDELIAQYPQAGSLFSQERKVAVIIASLDITVQESDEQSFLAYKELFKTANEVAPEDFKLSFTGLTPVGAEILSALISDQQILTIFGLIFGTGIAFYIFRSVLAAALCALPPALTAIWAFGLFSFFEIPINYLTTVLPTLALILAFADGIFLYFRWQTLSSENSDLDANLTEAITKVGPASALTSLTTAIAFLSFSYADSDALKEFAFLGAGVVTLAFVGVIIGLPVAIHWAIRFGLAKPGKTKRPMFQGVGGMARRVSLKLPATVSIVGLVLVLIFGYFQQFVTAEYKLTQYLPLDSKVRYGEELANEVTGGRALLLVSVPFAEEGAFSKQENRQRLSDVEDVVAAQFGAERVFSANRILKSLETERALQQIAEYTSGASADSRTDFISKNADSSLVSVRLPSDMPVAQVVEETAKLRQGLASFSYRDDILVTGFPILMSVEFANLIDQLRTSLLIAVCLGIFFVGIATRSPFITLAAITPNLLPIFFVLMFLYFRGGTINLSEVVALTIAFGIAIDNAVHLINVYDAKVREGLKSFKALATAMDEVGPALTAGTVIICASTLVTQLSALPVVPILGQLIVSTLIVALIANLLVLPANILTLGRLRERFWPSK